MTTDVQGVPFHHVEAGAGRLLVCLHGWPSDHHHVEQELEPLFEQRDGWRRVYPDLPGMGLTPGADTIRTQSDMVDVVAGFVEAIAPGERYVVAGASYGAYLGRWLTARHTDRIDGFLAYVPAFRLDGGGARPEPTVLVPDADALADLEPGEELWASANTVHSRGGLTAFRERLKPAFARADHAFLEGLDAQGGPAVPSPMRPPFPGPTLLLAGRQDSWVGYADAYAALEDYPRGTYAVLDRAAHGLTVEQPALFRALVSEWLDRVEEYAG
jgi:pimeloyl-ACP methyl ester carboxylesterase